MPFRLVGATRKHCVVIIAAMEELPRWLRRFAETPWCRQRACDVIPGTQHALLWQPKLLSCSHENNQLKVAQRTLNGKIYDAEPETEPLSSGQDLFYGFGFSDYACHGRTSDFRRQPRLEQGANLAWQHLAWVSAPNRDAVV